MNDRLTLASDRPVSSLPLPEPERYVDMRELADLMGVSVSTVKRLRREGMPHETWGKRTVRFRPSVAIAWARSRSMAA